MLYSTFRTRLLSAKAPVAELIERIDIVFAASHRGPAVAELASSFPHIPFGPRAWHACVANATKLHGVRRFGGDSYATHPTRVALICDWLLSKEPFLRDTACVAALLHDYLEEGDGLTAAGLQALASLLPSERTAVRGAVLLSEPLIDFAGLGPADAFYRLRVVAYVVQVKAACASEADRSLICATLADQLDNMHDLDYIAADPGLADEKKVNKRCQSLAYGLYVALSLQEHAPPHFVRLLRDATDARAVELGLRMTAVEQRARQLAEMERDLFLPMAVQIERYHAAIGLPLA